MFTTRMFTTHAVRAPPSDRLAILRCTRIFTTRAEFDTVYACLPHAQNSTLYTYLYHTHVYHTRSAGPSWQSSRSFSCVGRCMARKRPAKSSRSPSASRASTGPTSRHFVFYFLTATRFFVIFLKTKLEPFGITREYGPNFQAFCFYLVFMSRV